MRFALAALLALPALRVLPVQAGADPTTYGGCRAAIAARESGGSYTAYNVISGSYGRYQFTQGGVINETEFAGRDVTTLSPAEQERAFTEAVAAEGFAPWNGC